MVSTEALVQVERNGGWVSRNTQRTCGTRAATPDQYHGDPAYWDIISPIFMSLMMNGKVWTKDVISATGQYQRVAFIKDTRR
jgi:hypothetical protein